MVFILRSGVGLVPVVWTVHQTVQAGKGEKCAMCAALVYIHSVDDGQQHTVFRVLDGAQRDALLDQWHRYQADVTRSVDRPSKLEAGGAAATETRAGEGRVQVVLPVRSVWFDTSETTGRSLSLNGGWVPWRFEVHNNRGGWRIWSAELPSWCGSHAKCP